MLWLAGGLLVACGGSRGPGEDAPQSGDDRTQRLAIESFGRDAYDAIVAGTSLSLLADQDEVRDLVEDDAADRYDALRLAVGTRVGEVAPHAFADTVYAGICLQGLRRSPADGPVGLRQEAWVFDRALIVAVQPSGQRVASWLEGVFVQSGDRFVAIDLHRVEDPRWEHSDLEIAHCDVQIGMRQPQDVGMVTP